MMGEVLGCLVHYVLGVDGEGDVNVDGLRAADAARSALHLT